MDIWTWMGVRYSWDGGETQISVPGRTRDGKWMEVR